MATSSEEYEAIYQFLRFGQYPEGFSKNDKRVLRRKSKENYQVVKDFLFYRPRRGREWKKVPRFQKERVRIIEVCHSLPEGSYAATECVKYYIKLYFACFSDPNKLLAI